MRRASLMLCIATAFPAPVALAQGIVSPARFSLGVSAGALQSRDAGTGRTIDAALRWAVPRVAWLSVLGSAGLSSFGRSDLVTNSSNLVPDLDPLYQVYSLQASGASGMLGLELAAPRGRLRPYLHAMGGVTDVTVSGQWMRAYTTGSALATPYVSTDPPVPADEMRDTRRSARLGAGVRLALSRNVQADIGVRRSMVAPTTWVRTFLPSYRSFFDSSLADPGFDYRRSLSSWGITAGVRLTP